MSEDYEGTGPREWWLDAVGVLSFAWSMWKKLRKNRHKAHWSGYGNFEFYRQRIEDELSELTYAHESIAYARRSTNHQPKLVVILQGDAMREAADVGNFAMMIHERARKGIA